MRSAIVALLLASYAAAQASNSAAAPASSNPPQASQAKPTTSAAAQQSTPAQQQTTPAAPSPAAPSTTSYTGTPTIWFQTQETATVCEQAQIRWTLANEDPGKFKVDLYVFNVGVDQTVPSPSSSAQQPPAPASTSTPAAAANTPIPSSQAAPAAQPASSSAAAPANANNNNAASSPPANAQASRPATQAVGGGGPNSAAAAKRGPPGMRGPVLPTGFDLKRAHRLVPRADVNSTIVKDWSASISYRWTVDVPAGRYQLMAVVNDAFGTWTESDKFTIVGSSNTTCLKKDLADAGIFTSSAASKPTSTGAADADSGSANQDAGSKKKGLSGGAIAGIVIGVLASLALAALAFLCFRRAARDKRRDAGGREPQTPMRNLIGEPTNFRKTKGAGGVARESVGHALAAIGLNRGGNRAAADNAERGEKPMFPPPPHGGPPRRGSSMTTDTNDNPFETAPTTPVDEKSQLHTPGSSFGTSIPPASALAAGVAGSESSRTSQNTADRHPGTYLPQSPPQASRPSGGNANAGPYDAVVLDDHDFHRRSTPTPRGNLPVAALAPSVGGTSVGTRTPGEHTPSPNTPVTPGFTNVRGSHQSRPSASSLAEAGATPANAAPPPSAFQAATPVSPQKQVERKTSLRRKPVPRLNDENVSSSPLGSVSNEHSSDLSRDQYRPSASASTSQPRLPLPDMGRHSGSDEFGLNAALGLDGGSKTFQLMPDPPLNDNDRY